VKSEWVRSDIEATSKVNQRGQRELEVKSM